MKKNKLKRSHLAKDLANAELGTQVRIAGWIEDIRSLGSLVFMTVRDVSDVAQVVFRKNNESVEVAQSASRQSVVVVNGVIKESRAKQFKVEVEADSLHILSEAIHPLPIDPTGRVESSIDTRIDSRPLDLRNHKVSAIFKVRHTALQSMRSYFVEEGFMEVNTAKIIGQAVEGGANLFGLDYFGKKAFLSQSPQLYKEQLTLSLDRVFEIADYFRAEKSHTSRHISEFTSVDIEAAFMDEKDVMAVAEGMVVNVIREVVTNHSVELNLLGQKLKVPDTPFPRISYQQAIEDLREEGLKVESGEDLTDHALKRLGNARKGYYFITEWPTILKPFYIEVNREKPEISTGFDLQFGETELASGGMRISNRNDLESRLKQANLKIEAFSSHLDAFNWGMPPHSGWGFGLDRFIMAITGVKNVREVVLYPRDTDRLTP